VLRSYSPVCTLGGGEVLDILPPRYTRVSENLQQRLEILKKGDIRETLLLFCREAGPAGLDFFRLQGRCGLAVQELQTVIDTLLADKTAAAFSTSPLQITLPDVIRELEARITGELKTYHKQNPLKAGMLKEELKVKLPKNTDAKLYAFCIEKLEKKGGLTMAKEFLALPEHKPVLKEGEQGLKQRIAALYRNGGKEPPTKKELIQTLGIQEKEAGSLLNLLVREGVLVKISEDIFYDAAALQALVDAIAAHMQKAGELTIQSLKDLTGLSRKFMIPLLEHLDKAKITMRMGDRRVLRKQGN
jgi:selenocysteine-specific elongation factor